MKRIPSGNERLITTVLALGGELPGETISKATKITFPDLSTYFHRLRANGLIIAMRSGLSGNTAVYRLTIRGRAVHKAMMALDAALKEPAL